MKIAIVSTMAGNPWGGSEELWAAVADEALGLEHSVAVSVYKWPSTPTRISALEQRGAQIFGREKVRPRTQYQRLRHRVVRKLKPPFEELCRFAPDVVFISQGGTYDALEQDDLVRWLFASGLPYVVVCHLTKEAWILEAHAREAIKRYFAGAYRMAFVSDYSRRTTERQLVVSLPNAVIVRNPVNMADTSVVPWPGPGPTRIGSVARLEVADKGQDLLLEALASSRWRERDWKLSMCGDGRDRRYLEDLAEFYGLSSRISFLGHVGDVREIWSQHHLLVMPSREESAPLALVEAMLCGRPCVATDVGGMMEWIQEGRSGFRAEAPTASALAEALDRAWAARSHWQQMGLQAHEDAWARCGRSPGRSMLGLLLEASGSAREDSKSTVAVSLDGVQA